ncbi:MULTISPECIES: GntR family transcriptional regulator [Actinomycetes]|uniref:GntR family transcriptional regulator n=2 Tax=Actinomycetes TaxID=1760 RepID=A0ABP6M420_9MICC
MRASDRAYRRLREEILDGALAPGTVLGEVEQSERLGVSRTPVREALSRLTADGLADQAQGRGTVVSSVSLGDVDLLFELRLPLEMQAARLAAQRGDPERFTALARRFAQAEDALSSAADAVPEDQEARYYDLAEELDDAVAQAVDNPYLTGMLRSLRVHLVRVRRLARDEPARLAESAREHRSVCTAIASGDPDTAGAAMLIHLRRSLAYITGRAASPADSPQT